VSKKNYSSKFHPPKYKEAHFDDEALEEAYQIDFLPYFEQHRGSKEPFVNEYGVVIGDRNYNSSDSPMNQWSTEIDPSIMSGDQWVHPYNDVGFNTRENRDIFEKGVAPLAYPFMHPTKDVSYHNDFIPEKDEE
jgi:hypothetical protein